MGGVEEVEAQPGCVLQARRAWADAWKGQRFSSLMGLNVACGSHDMWYLSFGWCRGLNPA